MQGGCSIRLDVNGMSDEDKYAFGVRCGARSDNDLNSDQFRGLCFALRVRGGLAQKRPSIIMPISVPKVFLKIFHVDRMSRISIFRMDAAIWKTLHRPSFLRWLFC